MMSVSSVMSVAPHLGQFVDEGLTAHVAIPNPMARDMLRLLSVVRAATRTSTQRSSFYTTCATV
eukprot:1175670-Pyramimonas_sp.AAC.1